MPLQKYSLWLMPTGATGEKFSHLIARLAKQYSSQRFSPHITLIGLIESDEEEMISKAQAVATQSQPCAIKLMHINYTNEYYKSLFVEVEPAAALLATYQAARKVFPDSQATSYAPHLSLLYGNFSVDTKKQIINEIGDTLPDEFEARTLYLYLTDGDANTWHKIREFPL
jgi:2'-5' RNA ligase